MGWSATQYTKFEDERTRPPADLLAQLPAGGVARAVDIGCGPGNSTELLVARFPGAVVTGLDSSPDMIAAARRRLPEIDFALADLAVWDGAGGPYDVILANAVLQWVPDHAALMPRLLAALAPGGALAVQMPDNLEEPAHLLMRELAAEAPWAATLAEVSRSREIRRSVDWYYALLTGAGAAVDIWRTTYHHRLAEGAAGVVEWFKGSALRPYLAALPPDRQADFLARYEAKLAAAYPALPDGSVLLPFPRLFFVARRSG
jgi:trans-aconitate 2-methyltransferase